jgi:dihydrofolate reductase
MAIFCDITTSLDGFVAGPRQTLEQPLGEGGELLHEWLYELTSFRDRHGQPGGEHGPDSDILEESLERTGAIVMGRRMFSGGAGPWEEDPNAGGWWGDEPPFHAHVFVLTHHAREPLERGDTTFVFVTEGIEAALERARGAAGGKDVAIAGGASVVQQYLAAGILDELQVHVAPVLLGDGVRLFDDLDVPVSLEPDRVRYSPKAVHLRYRVRR